MQKRPDFTQCAWVGHQDELIKLARMRQLEEPPRDLFREGRFVDVLERGVRWALSRGSLILEVYRIPVFGVLTASPLATTTNVPSR